jgi:hypothetical protein
VAQVFISHSRHSLQLTSALRRASDSLGHTALA